MDRERRKSTREREAAIQETSVRVSASTSASVADVLGRQFAENVGEVRNLRQAIVANTGRLNALWEESQSGKQKRQDVRDRLNGYVGMSNSVFGLCHAVGPPNHGETSAQVCLDDARQWTSSVAGYISGSLGDLYLNRFEPAGLPNNSEVAQLTGIDSNLDARIAAQV